MTELRGWQKEAIKNFEEDGYLIVDAPRQCGKTALLKEIIDRNRDESIGVMCKTLKRFDRLYGWPRGCTFIRDWECAKGFTMLIGDEVRIEPIEGVKTACAYTSDYKVKRVKLSESGIPEDKLREIKRLMPVTPRDLYEIEYGQYE